MTVTSIAHFISGHTTAGTSTRAQDVFNPATGAVTGRVHLANVQDVAQAVASAQAAFPAWADTPPLRRARVMFKYLELLNQNRDTLARMITAGVNVVRLNFSHGTAEEHIRRAEIVRNIAMKLGRPVGVLCDLQGPKIRIGKFELGKVTLKTGDVFVLDADCELGNQYRVGLDYRTLPQEVTEGIILLLDDGRITMQVDRVKGNQIHCVVLNGGVLSNNKGINRQGGGLSADALTKKHPTKDAGKDYGGVGERIGEHGFT